MDRELYRRRQRRRAIIAWSFAGLVIAAVALGVIFGATEEHHTAPSRSLHLFASEMSSEQYEAIHKGEDESQVLLRLRSVGLQEDELDRSNLPSLFPSRPQGSTCSYWTLSDAPGHLVRLCFSDPEGVLLQKSVAISGNQAPKTLA